MPLHSHELEQRVLKWIISNPDKMKNVSLVPEDFHMEECRDVYKIMAETFEEKAYIDEVILRARCAEQVPDEVIDDIMAADDSGGLHYADEVKRFAHMRKLKMLADKTLESLAANEPKAIDTFYDAAHELQRTVSNSHLPMSADEMADAYEINWDKMHEEGNTFFRCGYEYLDDYVCFQPGKLYTLAARSSVGKTSIAQTMGIGFAKRGFKTLYFTMEMDHIELCDRMCAIYAQVSNTRFKYGTVSRDMMKGALDQLRSKQKNFYLQWEPNTTIKSIMRTAYDMKNRLGLDVIIIDYLQLIRPHHTPKGDFQMHRFIADVTKDLKMMAGELGVAIIQLSQVSRGGDQKSMPTLDKLKESGDIENNSDVAMFLHRDDLASTTAQLCIAKNRSGPAMGVINFNFKPEMTMYKECKEQDIPKIDTGKTIAPPAQESIMPADEIALGYF